MIRTLFLATALLVGSTTLAATPTASPKTGGPAVASKPATPPFHNNVHPVPPGSGKPGTPPVAPTNPPPAESPPFHNNVHPVPPGNVHPVPPATPKKK